MSSTASRLTREARREALRRKAADFDRALAMRDEAMAVIIQARELLRDGNSKAALEALADGEAIDPLPQRLLDLVGFAAEFNGLCLRYRVRAAWFTTTPAEGTGPVAYQVHTGGEKHHDELLKRTLEAHLTKPDALRSPEEMIELGRATDAFAGGLAPDPAEPSKRVDPPIPFPIQAEP